MKWTVFNRKSLILVVTLGLILASMSAAWAGIQPEPFRRIEGEFRVKLDGEHGEIRGRSRARFRFNRAEGLFQAVGRVTLVNRATGERGRILWQAAAAIRARAYAGVLEAINRVLGNSPGDSLPSPGFTPALVRVSLEGNIRLSAEEAAEVGTWLALIARPATGDLLPTFADVGAQLGIPIHKAPDLRIGFIASPDGAIALVTGRDGRPVSGARVFVMIFDASGGISCSSVVTGPDGKASTAISASDSGFVFATLSIPPDDAHPSPDVQKSLPVEFGSVGAPR